MSLNSSWMVLLDKGTDPEVYSVFVQKVGWSLDSWILYFKGEQEQAITNRHKCIRQYQTLVSAMKEPRRQGE